MDVTVPLESVRFVPIRSCLFACLCVHLFANTYIPFWFSFLVDCTYAHGEEELQMTKLVDLHEAGLVDMETYRTKPCLTWITTGSWYVVSWSVVCMSAQLVFTV